MDPQTPEDPPVLPTDWNRRLEAMRSAFTSSPQPPPVAVLDMDNTLLIHDAGEAVFARLRALSLEGKLPEIPGPLPLSWPQYAALLSGGRRREAYCRAVTAMAGLSAATVARATRDVMEWPGEYLEVDGARVRPPRADPLMSALLTRLKSMNFAVFLISASNQITVRVVAARLGLSPDRAWGIRSLTQKNGQGRRVLSAEIAEPVPYDHGKVELYRRRLGNHVPLVSAGDSPADIPLLNLTSPQGLVIWAGSPEHIRGGAPRFRFPEIVRCHPRCRTLTSSGGDDKTSA